MVRRNCIQNRNLLYNSVSIDNKHIVIPNGTLSGSIITNVTARDLRKLEIKVGISYDSDIKKAKAILEEILHNDEDTKDDQGMVVFVDELGESAVVMGLRVWVATEKYWPAKWRLNDISKKHLMQTELKSRTISYRFM